MAHARLRANAGYRRRSGNRRLNGLVEVGDRFVQLPDGDEILSGRLCLIAERGIFGLQLLHPQRQVREALGETGDIFMQVRDFHSGRGRLRPRRDGDQDGRQEQQPLQHKRQLAEPPQENNPF